MSKRSSADHARALIEEIDQHLREAERLRDYISKRQPRLWPDRRRAGRVPAHVDDPSGDGEDAR